MAGFPRDIHEDSAPFNMALATLKRISDILEKITATMGEQGYPPEIKQARHLNLVKELFINSAPLLKTEVVETLIPILDLKPMSKRIIESNHGKASIVVGNINKYDFDLEKALCLYAVKIQNELQKEKYFMPPKADPTSGWKQN